MIKHFENLSTEDEELLLKAPVLVSIVVASVNHKISKEAKADAIKLSHLKTFTAVPLLIPYYKEVEKNFKSNFEAIVAQLSPIDSAKRKTLLNELDRMNHIISKLDKEFGNTLQWSLAKYAAHVKKSERVVLENIIFPFMAHGFTK